MDTIAVNIRLNYGGLAQIRRVILVRDFLEWTSRLVVYCHHARPKLRTDKNEHHRYGESPSGRSSKKTLKGPTYPAAITSRDLAIEWRGSHATKVEVFTPKNTQDN